MKKIYLHIGAGKTGTSALQLWLYDNHKKLKSRNVLYPVDGLNIDNEYQITSGNGVFFINAIRENRFEEYLKRYYGRRHDLLFSSESFQGLNEKELLFLKRHLYERNIKPVIIIYVRDLYNILYSSYHQFLKRHSYTKEFKTMIYETNTIQQFQVLHKYEKFFDDIKVIHYDTEAKSGIEKPFFRILNIPRNKLNPMKRHKVNRSLTVFEAELLRILNKIFQEKFGFENNALCTKISDTLIYEDGEKETELYLDDEIVENIQGKFGDEIDYINRKYLDPGRLKVLNTDNVLVKRETEKISKEFITVLKVIIDEIYNNSHYRQMIKEQMNDLIGTLYSEAQKRENENSNDAIKLLAAAKVLRPKSPKVTEKLKNLRKKNREKK